MRCTFKATFRTHQFGLFGRCLQILFLTCCSFLRDMTEVMSTSLKVVSMAVVFCDSFSLCAIFKRILFILT